MAILHANMIGEHIKEFREEANLTQEELAKKSGVSKNTIYMYEKGRRIPSSEVIARIASALSITPNEIYIGAQNALSSSIWGIDKTENYLWIPIVDIEACAGDGNGYYEYDITTKDYYPINKNDLLGHSWQNNGYKIISITGDSMEPRFHHKDNILISVDEPLATGNIVVVWWNNKLYIRGYIEKDNTIILKPLNPKYSTLEIEKSDDRLFVVGKVIAKVPAIEKIDSFY